MNYFVALPLAAVFVGMAAGAQAFELAPRDNRAEIIDTSTAASHDPYHRCHGSSAGTASAACGTATGGPVGGLN